jgi:hypothetical protein
MDSFLAVFETCISDIIPSVLLGILCLWITSGKPFWPRFPRSRLLLAGEKSRHFSLATLNIRACSRLVLALFGEELLMDA